MTRAVDTATYDALVAAPERGLVERNFLWIVARGLDGTGTQTFGFWNDIGTITAPVIDGQTGLSTNRDYTGDGAILDLDKIPLTSDLTVRTVRATLSQIHETVQDMVRGWDIRGAWVEVHRGIFDPDTFSLVAPAIPHFIGKIDKAPVNTPAVGEEGSIPLDLVSHTRELTRTNPAKKSDETQKRRNGDRLRRYVGVANAKLWWGMEKARPAEK